MIVWLRLLLLQVETLLEAVNTAAGINQLLLAGIEGMAVAADFHADIGLGGTGLELVTTSALDGGHLIVGMDTLFHLFHLAKIDLQQKIYYHKFSRNATVFFIDFSKK